MIYGKVWEFHPAMILKKYKHCPHCGEKLVKEKHKRIVTKDDEDFYEYYRSARGRMHGISIPIGDAKIDVVTTRYTCPACNKSYTYEQLRECVKDSKNNKKRLGTMKFTFEKLFKFSRFPTILKCHEHYNQLVEESYDMEAKYAAGQCSGDEWEKAIYICDEYYVGEYAQTVFHEFYGHGLYIKDWRTKKVMKFDDRFKAPFATINLSDRRLLVSLVELKYVIKLTADFYE